MPTTEFYGSVTTERYEASSGPIVSITVHESDCWPVHDNAEGTKDSLLTAASLYNGVHPVIALGGRTAADGRPLNFTGVVMDVTPSATLAESQVRVNIADGMCVRNWVANVLTYSGTNPATFETAPVVFQPVYVDDSQALAAGVTLSLSPLNEDGLKNPMAGALFYDQDQLADDMVGGARTASTFDIALSNSLVQQEYTVILGNGWRDLA